MIAIALPIIVAIIFARAGECRIPEALQFSEEFFESISNHQHSAGNLAWLLYYDVARQLAWHGSSDIQILDFVEHCQFDACSVQGIGLLMQFEHPAICSWARSRFNHTFVSIDIDDVAAPQADVSVNVIREGQRGYQPLPKQFIAEIDQLRKTAQASVRPAEWERYSTLRFGYRWWFGGEWDVYVSTMNRTQLHSLDIAHPRKSRWSK
ncbi:MAG: hypothetical protein OXG53_19100 [Chloroflexi bacterium]|nr:hypothetical protein [Chloroflexota bacterium]